MSFAAVVPLGGYAGWTFLTRTLESQKTAFADSPQQLSDKEYFAANIAGVKTAEHLVGDYRLLSVALGAFGLDDDLQNRFFIRKVLEDGTSSADALSNKLSDKSYKALSEAFGFGEGIPPRTGLTGFADEIFSAYTERQFEISVGEKNEDFRLALNVERELAAIASGELSDDGKWYSVMGSAPLRSVFETALGLPESFSSLDIEDQLQTFRDKATTAFGSGDVSQFADPDRMEKLVRTFLLRAELSDMSTGLSSGSIALTLLSGAVS
ncbi:DUF1217 domain-containing protein [Tropicimonas sediminicola]|uniref:Flagellar protein n=1 Tax=Tropicimonas sediminicola TaxID=1031541 RepID=A0A239JD45_9RHOB|nr:DUF1217 domain-containing protein [Tropicimonas sediminicola]SNT03348.1 Protein of unknown function [Tropicimonas sediminicola]